MLCLPQPSRSLSQMLVAHSCPWEKVVTGPSSFLVLPLSATPHSLCCSGKATCCAFQLHSSSAPGFLDVPPSDPPLVFRRHPPPLPRCSLQLPAQPLLSSQPLLKVSESVPPPGVPFWKALTSYRVLQTWSWKRDVILPLKITSWMQDAPP